MNPLETAYKHKPDVPLSARHSKPQRAQALLTNLVKACIIDAYCSKETNRALDIGCGRGSDAEKFLHAGVKHYVGTDELEFRIKEGKARQKRDEQFGIKKMEKTLVVVKNEDLAESQVASLAPFDIVTSFLSLQYEFDSVEHATQSISGVAKLLLPESHFICMIPDGDRIMRHLKNEKKFGKLENGLFERVDDSKIFAKLKNEGYPYYFSLSGSFDHLLEYALSWEEISLIMQNAGFKPSCRFHFHDFIEFLLGKEDSLLCEVLSRERCKKIVKEMCKGSKSLSAYFERSETGQISTTKELQDLYQVTVFRLESDALIDRSNNCMY